MIGVVVGGWWWGGSVRCIVDVGVFTNAPEIEKWFDFVSLDFDFVSPTCVSAPFLSFPFLSYSFLSFPFLSFPLSFLSIPPFISFPPFRSFPLLMSDTKETAGIISLNFENVVHVGLFFSQFVFTLVVWARVRVRIRVKG